MLSIGAVYNGPELKGSRINRTLMAASKAVDALRGPLKFDEGPVVNAVFVVSGSLGSAELDHLEYGEYAARDKVVVVQIPVPESIVERNEHADFVIDALRGANAMAFDFFRQRGEDFPLREAEALVSSVKERLQNA